MCGGCHRVYHDSCLKSESSSALRMPGEEPDEEDEMEANIEWTCTHCKVGFNRLDSFECDRLRCLYHL